MQNRHQERTNDGILSNNIKRKNKLYSEEYEKTYAWNRVIILTHNSENQPRN